jgi:hypothetical protein
MNTIIELLKKKNISFEKGLTNEEYRTITSIFDISFPCDLKCFLQTALPVSTGFVNWRAALNNQEIKANINKLLSWPLEGILFDVHNNTFWENEWGEKPDDIANQTKTVEKWYKTYPILIPIYSHRYIPASPMEEGNPVFSVCQTDIVYYGYDIISYFCNEFNIKLLEYNVPKNPKHIKFWGTLSCPDISLQKND